MECRSCTHSRVTGVVREARHFYCLLHQQEQVRGKGLFVHGFKKMLTMEKSGMSQNCESYEMRDDLMQYKLEARGW